MYAKYLVIGVNAAGFYAIEALRKYDPFGSIIAVNGESYSPYKRTKINKKFSPPELDISKFQLADLTWYKENKITLLNNTIVTSIDVNSKKAVLNKGDSVEWDYLLLSTGAASFTPSRNVFKNSISIRSYRDALKVEELIKNKKNCLVYGMGIEGIETAAQLHEASLNVTIAGRSNSILKRYFSSHITTLISSLFNQRDISILYNIDLDRIHFASSENDISTQTVKPVLIEGYDQTYDFMLHSIGIKPNIDLAKKSGLKVKQGIIVNSKMETSVPYVYSAGDCTEIETGTITDHWHSAQDQGRTAAANMAGRQQVGCSPMHPNVGSNVEWPSKRYRVKVEIFGKYFFSMRPFIDKDSGNWIKEESVLANGVYRLFYYKNNLLQGLEMTGDKSKAKLYETAVNEEWPREKVTEELT